MKEKLVKIPSTLAIALGQYYIGRAKANKQYNLVAAGMDYEEYRITQGQPWDKEASLKLIEKSTTWGWEACAGTFCFYPTANKTLQVDDTTWPLALVIKTQKKS